LNKNFEFDSCSSRGKNKLVDEKAIKDTVKWSITEYSVFVSKLVKKGLSYIMIRMLERVGSMAFM
jgi:hypothetical protein